VILETFHQAWNEKFEFKLNKIAAITNEGPSDSHLAEMFRDIRRSLKIYQWKKISPHHRPTLDENGQKEIDNKNCSLLQIKIDLC